MLSATVERYADELAISFEGTELTYRELDAASSQLARVLIDRGAGPESVVAIAISRSADSVLAVWAVAKTGAAFLPIDPAYPAQRVAHMIADSRPAFGLADADAVASLPGTIEWLSMASARAAAATRSGEHVSYTDRNGTLRAQNVAYLIYTSGSTGTPKGVAVSHVGLAALAAFANATVDNGPRARVLHFASPSFDAAILEILLAHATGAALVVASSDVLGGPELSAFIRVNRVTHTFLTPAVLATVDPAELPTVRSVVTGGEACPPNLAADWCTSTRQLVNAYGPTESTVVATRCTLRPDAPVTIGHQIDGTRCLVLDSRLREVPAGVVGELYLIGGGLARGYHGRAALTSSRFVAAADGTRMYRTGDLVRWSTSAADSLEYLGRNDFQVKVRGLRIELGEIDAALTAHPDVRFAVTIVTGGSTIAAYVLAEEGAIVDAAALSDFAEQSLPRHMVPTVVTMLDELPLTPSGKLDRSALPEPVITQAPYRAPATPLEAAVCAVFAELLEVEQVSADDDFFALGGNSLIATQVVARLSARHGKRLSARALFDAATPARLATALAAAEGSAVPRPGALARPDRLPLSLAQQRYWILNQIDTASAVDNIPLALQLTGPLDATALAAAIHDVAARHESLRTIYPADADGPFQQILPLDRFTVDCTPVDVAADDVEAAVVAAAVRGFDVTTEPAWRVQLLRTDARSHVLIIVAHHIGADGTSMAPLAADVFSAYTARSEGAAPDWEPLPLQYADYALWQHRYLGSADDPASLLSTQLAYWTDKLADLPEQLDLPIDRPRPAVQSFRGAAVRFELDADVHEALLALGRDSGATLFMVMRAAFVVLLHRMSGTSDIAVGTPVAGRGEPEFESLIGMFVNTLVLRTVLDPADTFAELLDRVRDTDLEALAHADVPFERIVEALDPVRSAARNPVFQVGMSFQNMRPVQLDLGEIAMAPLEFDTSLAKTDLHLTVVDTRAESGAAGHIVVELGYAIDLFDERTVELLGRRYRLILDAILADPNVVVGDVVLQPTTEAAAVRAWSHGAVRDVPPGTLVDRFDARVAADPDAPALVHSAGTLTYREFDSEVNRLARHLIGLGVGPEVRVVVAIRRSVELLTAIYAVAKAGGVYVPVDPHQPPERTAHIVETAAPLCVLTTTADDSGRAAAIHLDRLDTSAYSAAPIRADERVLPLRPANTAYAIFTSGSTGRPKGVAVSHAAVVNQLDWKTAEFELEPADVALLKTTATFDLSVWEIWSPLVSGGSLVISEPDAARDAAILRGLIADHGVTILHVVPSMLGALLTESGGTLAPSLRRVLSIGEALPSNIAQTCTAHNAAELHNLYGPTETAVSVTSQRVVDDTGIGVPAWNARTYVLDARLRPVPPGVPGELYLGGAQLATEYIGQSGLTAERFVADPFGDGGRIYRTGDIVRWSAAGVLHYLGRTDHQVKLRGHRIELGDVEAALTHHAAVAHTAVLVRDDRLVAYVVAEPAALGSIRTQLRMTLPSYMVPAAIVPLPELPLTVNGKLDRAALPAPAFVTAGYREPRGRVEHVVARAFGDVLGAPRVGADDDFFALGGNSLLATRVVARIGAELDVPVQVRTLFDASTVADLAAALGSGGARRTALSAVARPTVVPLSYAQQRIWFLNRFEATAAYNIPMAVRLSGALDVDALAGAVHDVARRHETLRTYYPDSEQVVLQELPAAAELVVRSVSGDAVPAALGALAATRFDLTAEVPMRVRLFTLGADEHVLALVVHHIAADGASLAPLTRDLMTAYTARTQGDSAGLAALPVQYADYTLWQRDTLGDLTDPGSPAGRQLTYWREQLRGLPELLDLPTDRRRPAVATYAGARVPLEIDARLHAGLVDLARAHSSSLFIVLHAALSVLLARLSASADIAIGTPVAGRGEAELDDLVGMFVNTLVLRSRVDPAADFTSLVASSRETVLDALANSDVPFESIVEALQPHRSTAHHPLFQVGLALQNMTRARLTMPDLSVTPVDVDTETAQFDLAFTFVDGYDDALVPAGCGGHLTYATDLFDEASAQLLVQRYVAILESVVADARRAVGDLPLPQPGTALAGEPHTSAGSVLDGFAAQVRATPDAVAVTDGSSRLTYAEFAARVNRLARWLISSGAGPEERVAIALPRGIDMVTAMYATLTAGAAYVPIDPDHPRERNDHVRAIAAPLLELDAETIAGLDLSGVSAEPVNDADRIAPLRAANPAYVLFTSGSTGRPKGVSIDHVALHNQVSWLARHFALTDADVILQKTPSTFDVSVWELFCPLVTGGRMVVAAPGGHRDPDYLADVIARESVTLTSFVPSLAALFADRPNPAPLPSLRALLLAGEALGRTTAQALAALALVHNLYGPTEFTVHATAAEVSTGDVTIGSPVWNSVAHVLDSRLHPVPDGVPGELYLAGPQLARGYHGQPGLTAARFVPNPFDADGARMYRTGDIVRRTSAGALEYLGRGDDQVKVRGVRIELGEVEAALQADPAVAAAAAKVCGEKLVGYVVPAELDTRALRSALAARVPSFLVPDVIVGIDAMPLGASGKLDRSALPAPVVESAAYVAPRNPVEQAVAEAFSAVLEVARVGIDDDFFDLGGSSLSAVRLRTALAQAGFDVDIRAVFTTATVRGLAAGIGDASAGAYSVAQLEADASLDPAIGTATCEPVRVGSPEVVLLTGATGFVGVHLLREFLATTDTDVWCVVRAETAAAAGHRLEDSMRRYRVWDPSYEDRIVALPGDLAAPRLGLSAEAYARVVDEVDLIVHNGARVNHVEHYGRLKAANVDATAEVLRIATTRRCKPVHYVSTLSAVAADTTESVQVGEDSHVRTEELRNSGYVASKWVGEQLIRAARERGVPAVIHRPGLLSGAPDTGAMSTDDAFWNMMRAMTVLEVVPEIDAAQLQLTPVTYVAAAIVAAALRPDPLPVYHLVTDAGIPVGAVFAALRRHGFTLDSIGGDEFAATLDSRAGHGDSAVDRAAALITNYTTVSTGAVVASARTRATLADAGVECARVDDAALDAYVHYYRDIGFL